MILHSDERNGQEDLDIMSERARLNFLSVLLLLALGIVTLTVVNTLQAVNDFRQENNATKAGDVTTIRPWMTIHVISRVYHVPEDYLDSSLQVAKADPLHHATLYEIAAHKRQPLDRLIHKLQYAILSYRKEHSVSSLSLLSMQPLHSRTDSYLVSASGETKG